MWCVGWPVRRPEIFARGLLPYSGPSEGTSRSLSEPKRGVQLLPSAPVDRSHRVLFNRQSTCIAHALCQWEACVMVEVGSGILNLTIKGLISSVLNMAKRRRPDRRSQRSASFLSPAFASDGDVSINSCSTLSPWVVRYSWLELHNAWAPETRNAVEVLFNRQRCTGTIFHLGLSYGAWI
jgi:hypothetical protein